MEASIVKLSRVTFILLGLLTWLLLVVFFGFLPGKQIPDLGIWHLVWGTSECLANQPQLLSRFCDSIYAPFGWFLFQGHIPIWLSAVIIRTGLLSPIDAVNVVGAMYVALVVFSWILIEKVLTKKTSLLSLVAALLFSFNSMVFGHISFGTMFFGFLCIPLVMISDVWLTRTEYPTRSTRYIFIIFFSWWAKFLIAGTDWYSTVLALAFGMIWHASAFKWYFLFKFIRSRRKQWKTLFNVFIPALAAGCSWVLALVPWYILGLPGKTAYVQMLMDFFRASGLDTWTLFVPTVNSWMWQYLGIAQEWNPLLFYGDASYSYHNYIGFTLLFAMAWWLYRYGSQKKEIWTWALYTAWIVLFIVSLGPSFKFNSRCDICVTKKVLVFQDYLMPPDRAVLSLPTAHIYGLPVIEKMRVVYRWFLVPKIISLWILLLLLHRLRQNQQWLFLVSVLILLSIEFIPDLPSMITSRQQNRLDYEQYEHELIKPLKAESLQNKKVFFLNPVSENEYLANTLHARTQSIGYNGGGDKNSVLAQKHRPLTLAVMNKHLQNQEYASASSTLRSVWLEEIVDIVIIPNFSLRWDSYAWPPKTLRTLPETAIHELEKNSEVKQTDFYTLLRPREK